MIFELIAGLTLLGILLVLFLGNRKLKKEGDQIMLLLLEEYMKNQRQQQDIEDMSKLSGVDTTDGFVKFLSQSREWAYDYIDNVQQKLVEFDESISTELAKESLTKEDIAKISVAYNTLKESVLPENEQTPNN